MQCTTESESECDIPLLSLAGSLQEWQHIFHKYLSGEIISPKKIMRDEIQNLEIFWQNKTAREKDTYIWDPVFQTRKKETMEDGGGAGQNKADLPRYLTEQKTERERHGICEQAMR